MSFHAWLTHTVPIPYFTLNRVKCNTFFNFFQSYLFFSPYYIFTQSQVIIYRGDKMNELINKQLQALIEDTNHEISILSNASALLMQNLSDISWCGFYLYQDNELILGPFQGKVACTQIPMGKGVCGNSAADQKTYLVPNVHEFPGHIACDSASNSEIVIPILLQQQLYGVLDIDSTSMNRFTKSDQQYLENFVEILAQRLIQVKS